MKIFLQRERAVITDEDIELLENRLEDKEEKITTVEWVSSVIIVCVLIPPFILGVWVGLTWLGY